MSAETPQQRRVAAIARGALDGAGLPHGSAGR